MIGIKTGIHFGDGKQVVEDFRSSIIGSVVIRMSLSSADQKDMW